MIAAKGMEQVQARHLEEVGQLRAQIEQIQAQHAQEMSQLHSQRQDRTQGAVKDAVLVTQEHEQTNRAKAIAEPQAQSVSQMAELRQQHEEELRHQLAAGSSTDETGETTARLVQTANQQVDR